MGNGSGLSQAEIGAILGGVVAFVAIVLIMCLCISHSRSYGYCRRRRRRGRRQYYEASVSYERHEGDTEASTDATEPGNYHSRGHEQREPRRLSQREEAVLAANQAAAAASAAREAARARVLAQTKTRRFTAADVNVAENFVLNMAPMPRFPPTARPTNYRYDGQADFAGTSRVPRGYQ